MSAIPPSQASAPPREAPPWLEPLAAALAEALPRLHGEPDQPRLRELIAALTAALARGELELPLAGPPPPEVDPRHWPAGHRRALAASPLAAEPDGPLALEGELLLWRRWQRQRQRVLEALVRRAAPLADAVAAGPPPALPAQLHPLQAQAALAVLRHGLVLLEGGPGTGKTSTVGAMVEALLQRQPQARVQLASPTGKAAARLRAASGGRFACATLHRLLESRGDGFGRHRQRPLALDLLVVDEVSMVDLSLMGALLEALPEGCRLVLVGDPAQLPPVAPGGLLAALQRPALRQALGEAVITLERTWRNDGAIAAAAACLRAALAPAAPSDPEAGADPLASLWPLLAALPPEANLTWRQVGGRGLPDLLLERLQRHRQALAALADHCPPGAAEAAEALLRERDRLLVLCPLRGGPWGLEAIHRQLLGAALAAGPAAWPAGTPVLVTRNRADLGLANGDLGVVLPAPELGGVPWLLFGEPGAAASLWLHPAQLAGAIEPALALTVHKAQGSEAEEVVVLFERRRQADPRLLYTALTRARRRALLITEPLP